MDRQFKSALSELAIAVYMSYLGKVNDTDAWKYTCEFLVNGISNLLMNIGDEDRVREVAFYVKERINDIVRRYDV